MSTPTPPSAPTLVFDTSALVAWILQTQNQWQRVGRLLTSSAPCVMPASVLTETIYIARMRGNNASPQQIHTALLAQGLHVEPITEDDARWAGTTIIESHAHPAQWTTSQGITKSGTLALGDGQALAVAHRLNAHAVTFDQAWWHFPTLTFNLVNPWKIKM